MHSHWYILIKELRFSLLMCLEVRLMVVVLYVFLVGILILIASFFVVKC